METFTEDASDYGDKGLEMGFMGGLRKPDGMRKEGTGDILGNDGKPLMAKDC